MSKYYRQTPKALDPQTLEKCNASILKLANDIGFLGFPQLNSDIVANCSCNPIRSQNQLLPIESQITSRSQTTERVLHVDKKQSTSGMQTKNE